MEMKNTLDSQLSAIKDEVLVMGDMVQKALGKAIEALKKRDLGTAHKIMADDRLINQKRFEIEEKCINLIDNHHLEKTDLHIIIAILNIVTELERIGDYAEGIAKIVIMIGDEPPLKPLIDIPRMAELTIGMIRDSLNSFVQSDAKLANQVVSVDNVVDNLYDQVFRELLTFMMADPKTINRATRLIWVTHNLERAADRATNICERVLYAITGKMEEHEISKY